MGQGMVALEDQLGQGFHKYSVMGIYQGQAFDWMHNTCGWVEL